jgi:cytochrome c-type biogenesis protein CcsB
MKNFMDFIFYQNLLANMSFLGLFLTMFFYWLQAFFFAEKWDFLGNCTTIFSNASLFFFLCIRLKESGHFPLSNLYESLIFLSWSLTCIQLIIENFFYIIELDKKWRLDSSLITCILSPSALFIDAFATFSLPKDMQHSSSLVPALQSNWLIMHVTIMIFSYAALIAGCLLSISFLILTSNFKKEIQLEGNSLGFLKTNNKNFITKNLQAVDPTIFGRQMICFFSHTNQALVWNPAGKSMNNDFNMVQPNNNITQLAINIDNLSYRLLGIAFPLLTIGILSGAVWANEAWGSYWSWDPKETWALLTWLVFAIYLHMRLTYGWQGKKPAILASIGFVIIWICFLGVNLIGQGLHSYGWILKS